MKFDVKADEVDQVNLSDTFIAHLRDFAGHKLRKIASKNIKVKREKLQRRIKDCVQSVINPVIFM